MNDSAVYPIIAVPFALRTALNAVPEPPQQPVKAPFPVHPTIPPVVTRGIVCWLLVIVLGGFWLLDQQFHLVAALLTVTGVLAIRWHKRTARRRYATRVAQYAADFEQYLTYPERQAAYEIEALRYARPDTVALYRKQQIDSLLRSVSLPLHTIPSAESAPLQGRSEAYFLPYLQEYFGEETIYTQCRVPVDDPRLTASWFYPDFIYWDESGLCIDIEIDEPYAFRTKEPIHYQGQDDARNAYFLGNKWVVVRFTEEQVVRYPKQCCKQLAELIFSLTERHSAARFFSQSLPPVAQWTRQQARSHAEAGTRNSYLSLLTKVP